MSTLNTQISIDQCTRADIPHLQKFIDDYWNTRHILSRDGNLLLWQYDTHRLPQWNSNGPTILLASVNRNIVGMLGLIPFNLNVSGEIFPGCWLSQWFVTPEARNTGAGMRLLWATRNMGFEAIFAIGLNQTAQNIYHAFGFEMLPEVPRWVQVLNYKDTRNLITDSTHETMSAQIPRLDSLAKESSYTKHTNIKLSLESNRFSSDWDEFWFNKIAPITIGPARDSSYLNWRYAEHPSFKYEFAVAREKSSNNVLGLAVYRIEQVMNREEKILRVLEFMSSPESEEILTENITRYGLDNGIAFADYFCTSKRFAKPLTRIGFKINSSAHNDPPFPIKFQPLDSDTSKLLGAFWISTDLREHTGKLNHRDNFYITKSDSDQDRPN
tara:strand:- start:21873 stop:23024 length:1152 start_codon:yes stop_codon:yes gene_type:complete